MSSESSSNTGDWLHFYHPQGSARQQPLPTFSRPPTSADATVITTTATATTGSARTMPSSNLGAASSSAATPSAEGRVGRPTRRRSRASRRAPTTLLNTDTTNFRAMVQQFTGAPTGPFAPNIHAAGSPGFNFDLGGHDRRQGAANINPRPYYPLQHHQYSYHPQQQQQQQQRQQEEIAGPGGGDAFLRGYGAARPQMDISQGFLENFASHMVPRQPTTESDTSGYIL